MHQRLEPFLNQIRASESVREIFRLSREFTAGCGAIRHSYHFTPPYTQPTARKAVVRSMGYPRHWVALYDQGGLRTHDPIPDITIADGPILTWQEAMALCERSAESDRYREAMDMHGLQYGLGMALYGTRCRITYASIGFSDEEGMPTVETTVLLYAIAQIVHLRICALLDNEAGMIELSRREKEVLEWVARGKSRTDIGGILSLSPETVRTYIQRIFGKLNVHDRVGATVKALRLGLIAP